MRRLGATIAVLLAACGFNAPRATGDGPALDANGSGMDAMRDATPDAPPPDTAPRPGRRKRITIDPAKVTGDQVAFPVWIMLTDVDLAARATMAGTDIHFTLPDGTALEHQIQGWSKQTGKLEAWVRVDLADAAPTELDLRYGDPAATHAPNPALVFSSSFEAVWHLDDALMNSTIADSTSKRSGTAMGGLAMNDQVSAQLGGGIRFSGNETNADQIQFTNPYTANGAHTISAWIDQKNRGGTCDSIVTLGNASAGQSRWFHSYYNADNQAAVGFYGSSNDWTNPANMNLENAGWTLVHWTFQGTTSRLYKNGAFVDMHTHPQAPSTMGTAGYLGYAPGGWGTCALNGNLDEVRLATVARDAGWIATEYENQKSPSTFYAVGAEQQVP